MTELDFIKVPTGRTHQVGATFEPIAGADGEPETEWALVAVVDGHRVPLEAYSVGYVEHMVGRDDTAVDRGDTTTPAAAASPELDAANARIADLEAQLADAHAGAGTEATQQPPPPAQ